MLELSYNLHGISKRQSHTFPAAAWGVADAAEFHEESSCCKALKLRWAPRPCISLKDSQTPLLHPGNFYVLYPPVMAMPMLTNSERLRVRTRHCSRRDVETADDDAP